MKKQNQKGITLIALIITIIVMLILVGVSVSVALNTGLFKSAQTAAKNTEAEKLREQELASGAIITETLEEVGAIKPNIGQITGLLVGDIVYYDEDKSGTNDEDEKYVVLYNSETCGCQIVSANLKDNITLGASQDASGDAVTQELREEAKTSYNNLVEILNTEASKYLNRTYGAYARCLGCNPMYGTKPLAEALNLYDTKEYYKTTYFIPDEESFYEVTGATEGFLEGIKKPDGDYITDWSTIYNNDNTPKEDFAKNFNGKWETYFVNDIYFIGDRIDYSPGLNVLVNALQDGIWLDLQLYKYEIQWDPETGEVDSILESVSCLEYPIRTVITLKSNCFVQSGAGNIDDPYTLSI